MEPWDVTIVGGGILGTSFAYWLANRYDGRIAVLEKESQVAVHTSRRNTGVIHRPFYLDPVGRKVFARSSQVAYGMWKAFAAERGLPWLPVGTFEVATRSDQLSHLEKYRDWGLANGMGEDELALLTAEDVRRLEPNVRCHGAIWSKTDTAVDYQAFTQALREEAERAGAKFLLGSDVESIEVTEDHLEVRLAHETATDRVYVDPRGKIRVNVGLQDEPLPTRFLINAAGGHSIDIAHALGVGLEYTDLHFRGEYWEVGAEWHYLCGRNIYAVPRHPELPFLDPHWIVRADGRKEIGPNAVPVPGPYTYRGFSGLHDARDGGMGLVDLEAGDGEARPGVPPGASCEISHATGDRGCARPGRRPPRELREGGDRDARAALIPRRKLQFPRRDRIACLHRVDCEPPREGRPPRPSEGEGG